MTNKAIRNLCLLVLLLVAIGCGGGGGGGSSSNVQLFGNVLWIETGQGTTPPSTVRIDTVSGQTASDGFFNLTVPSGSTSLTVTFTPTSGAPVVRTFAYPAATGSTDLGDLWIGPATTSVTGRLVDSTTAAPLAGGAVSLAGQRAVSGADGRFTLTNVAFSATNSSIFLGLEGQVNRATYFTTAFGLPSIPVGGSLDVGDVAMVPIGGNVPPPQPFNTRGVVSPNGAGAVVEVLSGSTVIRTTFADNAGTYTAWLPAGTYTVRATSGSRSGTSPATITNVGQVVTVNVTIN